MKKNLLLEWEMLNDEVNFPFLIEDALIESTKEKELIDDKLCENAKTIENIKSHCDKIDYILSACSGIMCGIIDVFLVGDPTDSKISELSDKWFSDRIMDFSKKMRL